MKRLQPMFLFTAILVGGSLFFHLGCGSTPNDNEVESSDEVTQMEETEENLDGSNSEVEIDNESSPQETSETDAGATPETEPENIIPEEESKKSGLLIRNSDFVTGSYSIFSIGDQSFPQKDVSGPHSDAHAVVWKSWIFFLNRYRNETKEDEIILLDTQTWNVLRTIPIGFKSNPQSLVVIDENKAYVFLYGSDKLLTIDPSAGTITKRIDLSSLAEESTKACQEDAECQDQYGNGSGSCDLTKNICKNDGLPEMGPLFLHQQTLYVAIQGLDRNQGFLPLQSQIALVDTQTDTLSKTLPLKSTNPVGFVAHTKKESVLVLQVGKSTEKDGGLQELDLSKKELSNEFIITEQDLNMTFPYNGSGVTFISDSIGYIVLSDENYKQSLVQFHLTKKEENRVLIKEGSIGSLLLLKERDELFVADRLSGNSGIRIFNATSGNEITTQPLSTGNNKPAQFLFLPNLP